jgi:hypothetical protein
MTVEHRVVVGIEDIKAVCFECIDCGARAISSADFAIEVPSECQQCHKPWGAPPSSVMKYRTYETVMGSFVEAISGLREIAKQNPKVFGFRLMIGFDDPRS